MTDYRRFYYRVVLRCEFGPEKGWRRTADCMIVANNAVNARRGIIEFVAEQNRPPVAPADGTELSFVERQHVSDNWPRWVVESIDVGEPFAAPDDANVFWDNWTEIPPPEDPT